MAARYDKSSNIDPELRGTVDFDFFESEDFDKNDVAGDKSKDDKNDDYDYYDDDDDFESDDEEEPSSSHKNDSKQSSPSKTSDKSDEKREKKDEMKSYKKEEKNESTRSAPERSESPTPRAGKHKTEPRKRRDSDLSSSDSDITEVSPLGSTDHSPKHASQQQKHKQSNKNKKDKDVREDKLDMDILMDTIMKLEKERSRQQQKNVMFIPPKEPIDRQNRDKNFSFDRSQLEEIERENHRLLHKILHQHQRKKKPAPLPSHYAAPPCKRQFHSALNRQREQRRIEQENLKILDRLMSVKPSKEISRDQLLKDTRKQAMYGIPVHTRKAGRRRSDLDTHEETFEDGEWEGETQMSRLKEDSTSSMQQPPKRKGKARPSSGRPKPEWNDRW